MEGVGILTPAAQRPRERVPGAREPRGNGAPAGFGRGAACLCRAGSCGSLLGVRLTAVFEPAPEGGFTCFVKEVPAAISQGETLEEARENLRDALKLVIQCQRELADQHLSPDAVSQPLEFAEA